RIEESKEKEKAEMISKFKNLANSFLGKVNLSTDNFQLDKDENTVNFLERLTKFSDSDDYAYGCARHLVVLSSLNLTAVDQHSELRKGAFANYGSNITDEEKS
ncbi:13213_t:CDS:2, partial [Entrophospora sp. SA101]